MEDEKRDEGKTFKIVGDDMSDGYHTFSELYDHRLMLFFNLISFGGFKFSWKKEHYKGWDALYLELPTGQISYHVPIKYRYLYENEGDNVTKKDDVYDGHSGEDVLFRMERNAFYGVNQEGVK